MYHPGMLMRLPRPLKGPLLAVVYFLLWQLLSMSDATYWALPAGLRFAALLLTPARLWPWLIGAEWTGMAYSDLWNSGTGVASGFEGFMFGDAMDTLVSVICVAALQRAGLRPRLHHPEHVARLLASALIIATAVAGTAATVILAIHHGRHMDGIIDMFGDELLGEYLGMLLLTPVLILILREPPRGPALNRLLLDALMVMLPALLILLVLMQSGPPLSQFARVLALAPVMFFAFRHGWRGATLSMLTVSVALVLFEQVTRRGTASAEAYLFLAVAGTATLMLGSAIDALRRSGARLAVQNARLEGANRRLDHLARQLSDAARRNLRVEEDQRRYVAAELHDELGQNLTAIQTRVKLAQSRLREAGLGDVATSINDILAHMRAAVRRLLDNLRPTVLDEFGLARALDEGPIRDLLHTAGITYHFDLNGDLRSLDEDTRITVYRVVQEAATNAVRHAHAHAFRLRLRIGERSGTQTLVLDIRDDGIGLRGGSGPRRDGSGRGLQSMRDRVTALGGIFRVRQVEQGTRLHVLLRAPKAESQPAPQRPGSEP